MSKIIKNTLLNYVPNYYNTKRCINSARIFDVNNLLIKGGKVLYLCERELRAKDNFALQFALQKSKELGLPLRIIHPKQNYVHSAKQNFIDNQVQQVQTSFKMLNFDFKIIDRAPFEIIKNENPAVLIIDFNPILKREYLKKVKCKIYEIDGHNIIPARFVSDKQEYSAATFRRKIYSNIYPFLTEFDDVATNEVEAESVLKDFINNKLSYYSKYKNYSTANVVSGLSKYLNLGFISSQRVALEVLKSRASAEDKESFLEELIVRKELSDNFCLYAENFKDFSSVPAWAKLSLASHKNDLRTYTYTIEKLENAKTHDKLWNNMQIQLVKEGRIHGYLRMYWAKKILEWTESPEEALNISIYLNDKYAYDSPSSNGYVGILWAIGGLHDRAFRDHPVTGKIRRMTYNSINKSNTVITVI